MKKKKVVIIHGWQANPLGEWIPWMKKNLEDRGFLVIVPEMPDTDHPKEKKWVAEIARAAGKPDEDTYFICHSLGCIATVRYLFTLNPEERFGGAVFVAGFSGNISIPELAEFYDFDEKVSVARKHLDKCTMIYSDNDEVVSIEKSEDFKRRLGDTKGILVPGKGHFSEDEGIFELPEALEELVKMAS